MDPYSQSPKRQKFYLKNPTLRLFMPFGNIPRLLALIASYNTGSCILKESGPIETY